ncbi:YARHG domain-containing protein [Romboutsia sp. Marseille-P6047]|uniref:YARHG domain-containing protein n=1 Tax=Romboutsia sp. Marseille-P6047 TaxID=2161817 RepID=UPI000F05A984|nr:YARHG domain-containing protein [Romboutsia sp. Marseille-P6047]
MKHNLGISLLISSICLVQIGCSSEPVVNNNIVIKDETTTNNEKIRNDNTVQNNQVIKENSENNAPNNYYIISYSSSQYLTYDDIRYLSKEELALARNEIFARHGYTFDKAKYKNYFSSQQWYTPIGKVDMNTFSDIEKYNINFIKSYE